MGARRELGHAGGHLLPRRDLEPPAGRERGWAADGSFGWLVRLASTGAQIRDELNDALAGRALRGARRARLGWEHLGNDCPGRVGRADAWKNWHLIEHGRYGLAENAALLPRTVARLRECRADFIADEVMIARQPPKTGIDPHSDGKNFMLAAHIGLVVPPDQVCWMRVGTREHRWAPGRACVLNSSASDVERLTH